MRMLMLVSVIVSWQMAAPPNAPHGPLSGQVTDTKGAPLAGVRITDNINVEIATGSDGRYAIENAFGQMRFLKSGYRPVTKAMEPSGRLDVVLEPVSETPWAPPACAAKPRGKRIGKWMQFTVPKSLRVRRGQDIDYRTESITVRGAWMEFGSGPHWSSGFPPSQTLGEMVSVEERVVSALGKGVGVSDYRGVRADGTRWRTVVTFGESITYDRADAVAAATFDALIASMCFAEK